MALPDRAKIVIGTPIVLGNSVDYVDGNGLGARTDQIDLTSLAAGAARQSDKFDLGVDLDLEYVLAAAIEFASAPTSGETVDFYLSFSNSAAAGTGNAGGVSGSESGYSGAAGDAVADTVPQLVYVGSLVCTSDGVGVVQIDNSIGIFTPRARYATLVVVNNTGGDAFDSDAINSAVRIAPLETQIQD